MKLTPYLLFLPAILTCCGEDEIAPPQTEAEVEVKQIVLGDKLSNPYSLSVMQRAADELAESSSHNLAKWETLVAYYSSHLHYNNKTYTSLVRYLYEDCNFSLAEIESGFKRNSKWEELKSYFKNQKPERHADIENAFARCE